MTIFDVFLWYFSKIPIDILQFDTKKPYISAILPNYCTDIWFFSVKKAKFRYDGAGGEDDPYDGEEDALSFLKPAVMAVTEAEKEELASSIGIQIIEFEL